MTVAVDLEAFVSLGEKLDREHKWRENMGHAVYQQNFPPLTVDSTGLEQSNRLGPNRGFCWSIRRLTLAGWTGGTVTIYLNNLEPIPFAQAGMYTFGRGEVLLKSGEHFTIQATGYTGSVQLWGAADVFESWYLPYYIG
jgi:hypothetical protein